MRKLDDETYQALLAFLQEQPIKLAFPLWKRIQELEIIDEKLEKPKKK